MRWVKDQQHKQSVLTKTFFACMKKVMKKVKDVCFFLCLIYGSCRKFDCPRNICRKIAGSLCRNFAGTQNNWDLSELCIRLLSFNESRSNSNKIQWIAKMLIKRQFFCYFFRLNLEHEKKQERDWSVASFLTKRVFHFLTSHTFFQKSSWLYTPFSQKSLLLFTPLFQKKVCYSSHPSFS